MLFLVAMLGVGLAIAGESWSLGARRDRERQLLAIGEEFRQALRGYHRAQLGGAARQYPADLEDLLRDNRFPGIHRHLRRVYRDPMTGKTEWGLVRRGGRIVGVYSLSQDKPLKQEGFEPQHAAFAGAEKYSDWVFTYPVAGVDPEAELPDDGSGVAPPVTPQANDGTSGMEASR
jgi:type II secretory pathway pseudopilin PulG